MLINKISVSIVIMVAIIAEDSVISHIFAAYAIALALIYIGDCIRERGIK